MGTAFVWMQHICFIYHLKLFERFFSRHFSGQKALYLTVRVGSTNYDRNGPNGSLVEVEEIKQHQLYNFSSIDYDYSLLKLAKPLVFNDSVQPVKLPFIWNKLRDGTNCLVTGWGNTRNASQPRGSLRGAVVPIVNREQCDQSYRMYGGITKRMICAGYEMGGKDGMFSLLHESWTHWIELFIVSLDSLLVACQGDSGGPLVCNGIQYGIVSWGFGCAEPRFPGIYSNVYEMRNWIRVHSKF